MDQFPSRERSAAVSIEPRVSAVIVVHALAAKPSSRSPLDLCLRGALAEPMVDELVVVDHAKDSAISSMLRAFQADRRDVKLVVAQPAMSNAAAANLGVTQARGRWVLFLESDVVLQRGAVARLTALHANTPAPWISGGRLTDIAGRERSLTRSGSLNAFSAFAIAMGLPGAKQRRRRGPVTASPVAAVSGAFMLMPRADFEDLKGFDEGFVTAAADLDLCRRVAEAGGVVLYHPQAAGVQLGRRRSDRRVVQGLARFASKSAKTPVERVFAAIAPAALIVLMTLKDFVAGRPPHRR